MLRTQNSYFAQFTQLRNNGAVACWCEEFGQMPNETEPTSERFVAFTTSSRTGNLGYCASVICKHSSPSVLMIIGADDATSTPNMAQSSKSWYREGWTPPACRDFSSKGNYSEWDRRDTRGPSSSGYEDEHADWGQHRWPW